MKMYFQNIECGNIFEMTEGGYASMVAEAEMLYDYGDGTNCCELSEYYQIIDENDIVLPWD